LLKEQSGLGIVNCYRYYPIQPTDLTRLRNVDLLLESIPKLAEIKTNNRSIQPKELLSLCSQKHHALLASFLSGKLITTIEQVGPHQSLNLPNTFCALEINPIEIENIKKFSDHKNNPLALSSVVQEPRTPTLPPLPPIPEEPPLKLAKRLFPLKKLDLWNKADLLSITEVILLHYDIDPEICRVNPGEKIEDLVELELIDYLNRYFYSDIQYFLNQLDEDHLGELLERSLQAKTIHIVQGNKFSTTAITEWMQSKNLSFPLLGNKTNTSSAEVKTNINFQSLSLQDKFKLTLRVTASAICDKDKKIPLKQLVRHPLIQSTCQLWENSFGCKYQIGTYEDWIRDIRPNYTPRPRKK